MPLYAFLILLIGWVGWVTPFLLLRFRQRKQAPMRVDKRARWGIVLVGISYGLLWQGRFWEESITVWRAILSVVFFILAGALSWGGTRALGRQWRIDAGLNADHELITAGPYRLVRHPIYTSMLCTFCATGFLGAPWVLFAAAFVIFVIGTEIRVHIEDGLLSERFGEQFRQYQRRVAAYIPLLR